MSEKVKAKDIIVTVGAQRFSRFALSADETSALPAVTCLWTWPESSARISSSGESNVSRSITYQTPPYGAAFAPGALSPFRRSGRNLIRQSKNWAERTRECFNKALRDPSSM